MFLENCSYKKRAIFLLMAGSHLILERLLAKQFVTMKNWLSFTVKKDLYLILEKYLVVVATQRIISASNWLLNALLLATFSGFYRVCVYRHSTCTLKFIVRCYKGLSFVDGFHEYWIQFHLIARISQLLKVLKGPFEGVK